MTPSREKAVQNYISRTAKCTQCRYEHTLFFTEADAVEVEKRNIELEKELASWKERCASEEWLSAQLIPQKAEIEKKLSVMESQAARLREALESIRDNSGNHSECPVGFCVERVAKEALRPESAGEKTNGQRISD
jgi:hypothetical protein